MGAWATGPLDNDPAGEWISSAIEPAAVQIDAALRSDDPDWIRAAAWLLEQVGYHNAYPYELRLWWPRSPRRTRLEPLLVEHLRLAIEKLRALQESAWVEGWEDPSAVRAAIQKQIDALVARAEDPNSPESTSLVDQLEKAGLKVKNRLLR